MRFIPKEDVEAALPDDWHTKAASALADVRAVYDADHDDQKGRADAIKKKTIWSELRDAFSDLREGKCWYCESIIKRSHKPIDHYRPKNAVTECKEHGGYWWLAYTWENYRFCCTFCNTFGRAETRGVAGGKNEQFPVWDEANRAMTCDDDCDDEQPLLLDPFIRADTLLLWFEGDGKVIPHPRRCGTDPAAFAYRRADESIVVYNLMEDDLKERRGKHCENIAKLAANADRYYKKFLDGDATAHKAWEDNLKTLANATIDTAEYSAATIHTLMQMRDRSPTAEAVLEGM